VAIAQQADEEPVDEVFLADKDPAHLVFDLIYPWPRAGDLVGKFLGVHSVGEKNFCGGGGERLAGCWPATG
jgi:hypothetical protein